MSKLRGCSYENSFPVVFLLDRKKDIISLRSYIANIPRLDEIYFCGLLSMKILREANIQNGWQKLEEKRLNFVVFEYIRAWFSFYV